MNPVLEKLLVLQDRDKRLLDLKTALERVPLERAELERKGESATKGVEDAKVAMRHGEAERKKLEVEASSKQAQIQKYRTQLLEIKNNDQFHALQHEIAAAEQDIRRIEDRELEFMEQVERLQADVKAAEGRQKESSGQVAAQRKDLDAREAAMKAEIDTLSKDRSSLAAGIDEDSLSRYERIFKHRHGHALVAIAHGMCTGCHLKLTTQTIHDAMREDVLVTCTNCGRLLFHQRGAA
jgi:predicted  nucleic acid-binding Zn-ribbon protein